MLARLVNIPQLEALSAETRFVSWGNSWLTPWKVPTEIPPNSAAFSARDIRRLHGLRRLRCRGVFWRKHCWGKASSVSGYMFQSVL